MNFFKIRSFTAFLLLCVFLSNGFQAFAESQQEIQKKQLSGFSKNTPEESSKIGEDSSLPYVEGDVFVQYKTNLRTRSTPDRALSGKGLKIKEKMRTQGAYIVSADQSDKTTADIIQELRQDPTVEYVQPNFIYRTQSIPNDTNFQELWGLHNI